MRRIMKEEGMRALWSGVRPRVLFHTPAAALCWATYESMKRFVAV
jgi:solute carrier family 25 iron transporter 28/37